MACRQNGELPGEAAPPTEKPLQEGLLSDQRYATGMAVRRSVLGDAHVDRAESGKNAFDVDFQRFITEGAWGSVWSRPGIDRRTRSMLVIALMAALGHDDELALHLRATRNTGATVQDVQEVLLMVAVYAGVPAANSAIRIAKQVYAET
jgi:4-carboxymuconolactone decarboxylase